MYLQSECDVACGLAREAGAVILTHYRARDGVRVEYKDARGHDPVTQADRDANQIIVDGLRRAFPDDAILAEESTDDPSRLDSERLWCVDPLDGTREFLDRNGQFVVMIGLSIKARARLGVVYQPTEDILWWGVVGERAVRVGPDRAVTSLSTSSVDTPQEATMMVSRSHLSRGVTRVAQKLGIPRQIPRGSVGLKVTAVAEGTAEAYVSTTDKTKEWDACGPEAIVVAAGGVMSNTEGLPLVYNKELPNTPLGMVASNGPLHGDLVSALEPDIPDT